MADQQRSLMQDFLLATLERRLLAAGKTHADISAAHDGLGMSEAALSRLVRREAVAPREGVDAVVDAYAIVLGVSPIELWAEALRNYKRDPEGATLTTERALLAAQARARSLLRARSGRWPASRKPKTRNGRQKQR